MNSFPPHSSPGQAGFSLIEILVGLVIGLLVSLVIMQVFTVYEGQKRTTTGASDAQTNGSIALYAITKELKMAGYGLLPATDGAPLNCTTLTFGATGITDISPVIITDGGAAAGASDSIAIAIATANKVMMLEHAVYTVISPEGAASILWHDSSRAQDAATNMKITAEDLLKLGVIDRVISEPLGGAHREPKAIIAATGDAIADALGLDLENGDPIEQFPRRNLDDELGHGTIGR